MRDNSDETRMVFDFLKTKYTPKELADQKKYDEILQAISDSFDEATAMRYINAGFERPTK
jgi:hypothetical protein